MENLNGHEICPLDGGCILVDGFRLYPLRKKDITRKKEVFWYDPSDKRNEGGTSTWDVIEQVNNDVILLSNGTYVFITELYF